MLKSVNVYVTSEDISWSDCVGLCMDRAAALTGHKRCFQTAAKKVAPHLNFTHCIIQRERF
jgi:hypothetical protein